MIICSTEALRSGQSQAYRQERARKYFDILWTPLAAQANRDKNFKYQPDLCKSNSLPFLFLT